MKPEHWLGVAQIVITILGAAIGPWLAVKWSLKQFRSQKWWEKQQEAYTALLEHVSIIQYDAGKQLEAMEQTLSRTPGEVLKTKLIHAYRELEQYSAIGAYLISPEAARALAQFQRTVLIWSSDDDEAWKRCNRVWDEGKECISVLTTEAKRALL